MTRVKALSGRTFRSLRVRNYRLFFLGMLVSSAGTWMQSVAQAWLVLKLTGSGVALGVVTALQFLPILLFGVWGGVIADRVDKRRALVVTQVTMGVAAGALALVTGLGVVTLHMVYAAALLLGLANVVDSPTRQAFVTELVGPDEVPNAVALNSAMFNAARVVGPALAGALIVGVGIWPSFAFNSISFGAVIVSLCMMRPDELVRGLPVLREKGQARAGLRYAWESDVLRSTLILVAVIGTFALNFSITMPLMARYAFHAGAGAFGLITSAMGLGSMVGALATASRSRPTARVLLWSSVAFGVLMVAAAYAPSLGLELVVMPFFGAASITFMATANSTLQLNSSPEMRGRVMALYVLVFLGSTPIGGPIVGWVAQQWGPRASVALGGVSCFVGAALAAGALLRAARRRRHLAEIGAVVGVEAAMPVVVAEPAVA
jgi:MFS family permease